MNLGIVGNNDGPLYLLEALIDTPYEPQFIGLQKPAANNVRKAYQHHVDTSHFFEGFDEPALLEHLASYEIDLLINCFCNFRFDKILDLSFQVLNVHPSPLPAYRGRHPIQWALINGEKKFGISIHQMTEKFDDGEIYWQQKLPVKNGMSVDALRTQLMKKIQAEFGTFLQNYENETITPVPNKKEDGSYFPQRHPEDSLLTEWDDSQQIFRKVMALRSEDYPAYIDIGNMQIKCRGASFGSKINHDLNKAYIYNINSNKFQVVCLDGQTVWLECVSDRIKYLSLGQKLD